MRFECTINEAATSVEVTVKKNRPSMMPDTLTMEARVFIRRYRSRIPMFIKELLMKKQFSFHPNFIMDNAYTAGGEYRIHYEYAYPEIQGLTFQTFLKRVTRWRILDVIINIKYNPSRKVTTLDVRMSVLKPMGITPVVALEVRVILKK